MMRNIGKRCRNLVSYCRTTQCGKAFCATFAMRSENNYAIAIVSRRTKKITSVQSSLGDSPLREIALI